MIRHPLAARIAGIADAVGLILEKICGALCVFCFAAMTVTTLLGIFFRYVMNSPFMWTEEAARYLLVWMGFTAVSIALRQDKHIKIELLADLLPGVAARLLGCLVDLLMMVFFAVLLRQGYLMTVNSIMTASTLPMSMSWVLAAIPVAALLALIQIVLRMIKRSIGGFVPGSEAGPDAAGEPLP